MEYYTLAVNQSGIDAFISKIDTSVTPMKIGFSDDTKEMLLDSLENTKKMQILLYTKFNLVTEVIEIEVTA